MGKKLEDTMLFGVILIFMWYLKMVKPSIINSADLSVKKNSCKYW